MDINDEVTRGRWRVLVADTLADHPEWAADTVQAMQQGILESNERLRDRIADISLGLWQALSTTRKAKSRQRGLIIKAIKSSTLYGSSWAEDAVKKESE